MPRYVYRCVKGHEVELQRSVADRLDPVVCEICTLLEPCTHMRIAPALVSPSFPGADRWR